MANELGTSEYALHILFTNFVRIVEDMFAKIMAISVDVEPDIPAHFGPGVDPAFDKVLTSLGHIGSHKPTPIINTFMYWRKAKTDGTTDGNAGNRNMTLTPTNVPAGAVAAITAGTIPAPAATALVPLPSSTAQSVGPVQPASMRRATEPVTIYPGQGPESETQYTASRTAFIQNILRGRQQRCAIYILCRALIEVVKHTTADALTDDVASRIEPIVFRELVSQDSENYYRDSSIKSVHSNIFAELLGCFSNIR